ncbi:MAG: hypothetical protein GXP29_11070 [Planctomycetes bacterium]|nr:hypothetical protein [Planctomycetota bacterium]
MDQVLWRNAMRKFLTVVILFAVVSGTALVSTGDEKKAAVPPNMTQYFVGILYRGEKWTPEITEDTMTLQKAHRANIGRLAESGKLVLAGPFGDNGDMRGLFFFDVKTMQEARELVSTDPAVKAGRLRVDLHPWWGTTALRDVVKKHDKLKKPKGE